MRKRIFTGVCLSFAILVLASCNKKELSQLYVPEEQGITFEKITDELTDNIVRPSVSYSEIGNIDGWGQLNTMAISKDGSSLAFICEKNDNWSIFVRSTENRGGSVQRTFNSTVTTLDFSPDGENICYSDYESGYATLKVTNAKQGSLVQQISPAAVYDVNPRYSHDGKKIFFQRGSGLTASVWSYDIERNSFSNHCYGMQPVPLNDEEFLCTRKNSRGLYEIWRVNYVRGSESILVSQSDRGFTSPCVSPDGQWILCVSTSQNNRRFFAKKNLDIFLVRTDGMSTPTQLTFYRGNDYMPLWSPDGKYIYFLSQRGSRNGGSYNIWRTITPANLNVKGTTTTSGSSSSSQSKSKLPRKVE